MSRSTIQLTCVIFCSFTRTKCKISMELQLRQKITIDFALHTQNQQERVFESSSLMNAFFARIVQLTPKMGEFRRQNAL